MNGRKVFCIFTEFAVPRRRLRHCADNKRADNKRRSLVQLLRGALLISLEGTET